MSPASKGRYEFLRARRLKYKRMALTPFPNLLSPLAL